MRVYTQLMLCAFMLYQTQVQAGPVEYYLQKHQEQQAISDSHSIKTGWFSQLIDHNNPAMGQFSQRYHIDERYSSNDKSPVFFYICGESECSKQALNGAIRYYAQMYHAKLVALEHRYYGDSIPVKSYSTANLRHLSTEAALDDLAYFQRHVQKEKNWNGKWIAFGGSYPGSLAAYYRLKFPYLVAGALASSAPVMAKEDFVEYDKHVTAVAGPVCAQQMRQTVQAVETALDNKEQLDQIKTLFEARDVVDNVDFLYLIADIAAGAIQYGQRDAFCAALVSSTDPLYGYAEYAKKLYAKMGVTAVDLTVQAALSENTEDYPEGAWMRSWYYQSCSEYGYWQNAHPNPAYSSRSALINLDYHRNICKRLFGLNKPANTALINKTFYSPLLDELVSNIYFTNGEHDPWSVLSIAEKNGNAVNAKLQYSLIGSAAHCDDLRSPSIYDSSELIEARTTMINLMDQWL